MRAEIFDGTVEIKAVAREAGSRTKIAVMSHNPDVDAVGACIGYARHVFPTSSTSLAARRWTLSTTAKTGKVLQRRLQPATVLSVENGRGRFPRLQGYRAGQPAFLAIGNKGQNARLAAKRPAGRSTLSRKAASSAKREA